ncbi:MAG: ABC transporter permease [Minwuia sp.]|uniref:ABC transporter permease n=1 Tax=Minwuia sp. TaxID=2493630 RepID=UPI003A837F6C
MTETPSAHNTNASGQTVEPLAPSGVASLMRRFRLIRSSRMPWIAGGTLVVLVFCAVFADVITPWDPTALNLGKALKPPIWQDGSVAGHLLGTDNLGRDILSRIIEGARVTVEVGIYAIILSGGLGAMMGMISAYLGGVVDAVIMRLVDIQMSIPPLALAMVLAAVLSGGMTTVIIVIVLSYWTWYARIVRGEVLSLRERDFVKLARVAGCSTPVILWRHILPNVLNTLLVLASLQLGSVIIFEATLSFLGLGVQSPEMSWGLMLNDARPYMARAWWTITLPGIAIMIVCLAANVFGDWMRDTLDPKRRQL